MDDVKLKKGNILCVYIHCQQTEYEIAWRERDSRMKKKILQDKVEKKAMDWNKGLSLSNEYGVMSKR